MLLWNNSSLRSTVLYGISNKIVSGGPSSVLFFYLINENYSSTYAIDIC